MGELMTHTAGFGLGFLDSPVNQLYRKADLFNAPDFNNFIAKGFVQPARIHDLLARGLTTVETKRCRTLTPDHCTALRAQILGVRGLRREDPHMTLAHPRNPKAPGNSIANAAPAPEAPSRVIQRVEPDFPREAMREGYDSGVVKVRMDVDAEGNVTRVDILESRPRRVFDRAVSSALSQWKFNAGRPGRAVETQIAFRR